MKQSRSVIIIKPICIEVLGDKVNGQSPAMPCLILSSQMTAEQCEVWAANPNMYVADEDDVTCTARVSGELLLDELCRVSGRIMHSYTTSPCSLYAM
jgi:hypothetical protein